MGKKHPSLTKKGPSLLFHTEDLTLGEIQMGELFFFRAKCTTSRAERCLYGHSLEFI